MSQTPKIGQKPAPRITPDIPSQVSNAQAFTAPAGELAASQKAPRADPADPAGPGDGMAIPRPALQNADLSQPLDGAFQKKAGAPHQNLDLSGLDTDLKILSQSTMSLLTTKGLSAEYRATVGQWVGLFE